MAVTTSDDHLLSQIARVDGDVESLESLLIAVLLVEIPNARDRAERTVLREEEVARNISRSEFDRAIERDQRVAGRELEVSAAVGSEFTHRLRGRSDVRREKRDLALLVIELSERGALIQAHDAHACRRGRLAHGDIVAEAALDLLVGRVAARAGGVACGRAALGGG